MTRALDSAAPRVDWAQLRALVSTLFKARTRAPLRAGRVGRSRGLIFQGVLYAVMGALVGTIATLGVDLFSYELILFGMTLTVTSLSMMAESGDLLFGAGDYEVLGHRPVRAGTLVLARTLVLFGLTAMLGLAVNLGPLIEGLWIPGVKPWFPLAHLLILAVGSMFSASAVVFAYALLSRLVGRERFGAMASWLQLAITMALILGYQVVPRLIAHSHGFQIALGTPWLVLLPPAWFAALACWMAGTPAPGETARLLMLAASGLAATIVLVAMGATYLANDYARRLATLGETLERVKVTEAVAPAAADRAAGGQPVTRRAASRWLEFWIPDPVERATFQLVARYLRRDRDLRMRIFPALASYLAFPIVALVDRRLAATAPAISVIMIALLPPNLMRLITISAQPAAAELFRYAPLASTAPLFHGTRKAMIVFLSAPVTAIAAVLLAFAVRDRSWLLIAAPAAVLLPTLSLIEGAYRDYLPFSVAPVVGRQGAIQVSIYLGIAALIFGVNVFAWWIRRAGVFWPAIGIEIAAVAGLHALLLRAIRSRRLTPEP